MDDIGGSVGEDVKIIQVEGYLGGPYDKSLLVSYEDHVAMQLWSGVVSYLYDLI